MCNKDFAEGRTVYFRAAQYDGDANLYVCRRRERAGLQRYLGRGRDNLAEELQQVTEEPCRTRTGNEQLTGRWWIAS